MFDSLLQEIDSYAKKLSSTNPLYVRAANGQLREDEVGQFLENIRFLITYTVPHLKKAAAVAATKGWAEISEALLAEVHEEQGHDKWAENDLTNLKTEFGPLAVKPLPSTQKLIDFVSKQIEINPASMMIYGFFIEKLTVLTGPKLVQDIETKCRIPRRMLSVIENHLKLDVRHVEEGEESITQYLNAHPDQFSDFRDMVKGAMPLFANFCEAVTSRDPNRVAS